MRAAAASLLISVSVLFGCQERKKPVLTDFDLIQGEWELVAGERDGEAFGPDAIKEVRLVFTENRLITKKADGSAEATFELHPETQPKSIDLNMDGSVGLGIYRLETNSLSILHGEIEEPRPSDFEAVKDGNLTLLVLRRVNEL
jgi:uncharacterized protein (TIGR03067 family)